MICQQRPNVRLTFLSFRGTEITERNYFGGSGICISDLQKHFLDIARKNSPEPRTPYSYMTTAIVRVLPILIFSIYLSSALSFRTQERWPQPLR